MKTVIFVALGGCIGALARWVVSARIDGSFRSGESLFPLGIFVTNILGCLLFGWLFGFSSGKEWMTDHLRALLFTGFLGSFTTFSTFSWNTLTLMKSGQFGLALLNVGLSVGVGLASAWGGYVLGEATS